MQRQRTLTRQLAKPQDLKLQTSCSNPLTQSSIARVQQWHIWFSMMHHTLHLSTSSHLVANANHNTIMELVVVEVWFDMCDIYCHSRLKTITGTASQSPKPHAPRQDCEGLCFQHLPFLYCRPCSAGSADIHCHLCGATMPVTNPAWQN